MRSVEWSQSEMGLHVFMDRTRFELGPFGTGAAGGFVPNRGGRFVHSSRGGR
jgi:hypothetical protein